MSEERAGKKVKLTQHLDLGRGLTLTPDHEVHERKRVIGPVFSDRVMDADGNVQDVETLSTYYHDEHYHLQKDAKLQGVEDTDAGHVRDYMTATSPVGEPHEQPKANPKPYSGVTTPTVVTPLPAPASRPAARG